MKCNNCGSDMEYLSNREMLVPVGAGNPTQLKLNTNFYRCPECGKELFTQEESLRIAKIVDEVNDKLDSGEIKPIKIEEKEVIE